MDASSTLSAGQIMLIKGGFLILVISVVASAIAMRAMGYSFFLSLLRGLIIVALWLLFLDITFGIF